MPQHILARQEGFAPADLDPAFVAESRQSETLSIGCILFGVATIVVLLRVYVRVFLLRAFSTDDYLMLGALACAVVTLVTWIGEVRHGLGRHFMALGSDLPTYMKYSWINSIFIVTGIGLVKISLGAFLLRIAQHKIWRRFIIAMMIFLVLFTLACVGTLVFQCIPPAAAWEFGQRETAQCFDAKTYLQVSMFNSSINVATDFIFATTPIPMLWAVQLKLSKKVALMSILGLGYFACGAAVVKTVMLADFAENPDPTWNYEYFMWNSIEFHVGIVSASLPTLRPLFKSIFDVSVAFTTGRSRWRKSTGRYYGNGSNKGLASYVGKGNNTQSHSHGMQNRTGYTGGMERGEYEWDLKDSTDNILLEQTGPGVADDYHRTKSLVTTTTTVEGPSPLVRPPRQKPSTILQTTEISVQSDVRDDSSSSQSMSRANNFI